MNLEAKKGLLYNFFKGFDIKSIKEHIKCIDTSVVLTEAMAKALQLTDRPYVIAEGIVDSISENPNSAASISYMPASCISGLESALW